MGQYFSASSLPSISSPKNSKVQYNQIPDMCGCLQVGQVSVTGAISWSNQQFFTLSESTLSCWSIKRNAFIDSYSIAGSVLVDVTPKTNIFGTRKLKTEFRLSANNVEWLLLKAPNEKDQSAWVQALRRITASKSASKSRKLLQAALYGESQDDVAGVSEDFSSPVLVNKEECLSNNVTSPTRMERSNSYTVMDDISIEAEEVATVNQIAQSMGINAWYARNLLRVYKWEKNELLNDWENDATAVLLKAGLDPLNFEVLAPGYVPYSQGVKEGNGSGSNSDENQTCPICYEDYPKANMRELICNHSICTMCWGSYLNGKIKEDKRNSLQSTCPYDRCKQVITQEVWSELSDKDLYADLLKFQKTLFVENNESMQWCPNAGCGKAIHYVKGKSRDVICACVFEFCFLCKQGPHAPATCAQAKLWRTHVDESNTLDKAVKKMINKTEAWMASNTRPCPQCKCPIQKNHGCNHMTCITSAGGCGYEFCWVCMNDWKSHGQNTGGFYQCNVYKKSSTEATLAKLREEQSNSLDNRLTRFSFFSQRFRNHLASVAFAQASRIQIENVAKKLDAAKIMKYDELTYLIKTAQLVEKTHLRLAWSYCFRYFMGEGLHMDLFEAVQGVCEFYSDMLHECVDSASTLLKRPIATEHMLGAFRGHKRKVEIATPQNLRALKELQSIVYEMIETGVVPEPKMGVESDKEGVVSIIEIKNKDNCDFRSPWVCALCERSNPRDVDECEDCFQPRLVGDFRVRLDKIEVIQGSQHRRPADQVIPVKSPLKNGNLSIVSRLMSNFWHSPISSTSSPIHTPVSPSQLVGLSGGALVSSPQAASNFNLNANNGDWQCTRCTFINFSGLTVCEMCDTRRSI